MKQYKFDRKVKETQSQIKKHYTQFTPEELKAIKSQLNKINIHNIKLSPHALNHIEISSKDIRKLFSSYQIIEFNRTYKSDGVSNRVLIRSKETIDIISQGKLIKANICAVYDLTNNRVITIYMNAKDDSHDTLIKERYETNIKLDICNLLC